MAQRTPIRSILSVVPSTQASGETPKGEQPSERGASRARNSSEGQPPRQGRRGERSQNPQRPQPQPQQRQPFERTAVPGSDVGQEPILPLQSRRRSSGQPPRNRLANGLPFGNQPVPPIAEVPPYRSPSASRRSGDALRDTFASRKRKQAANGDRRPSAHPNPPTGQAQNRVSQMPTSPPRNPPRDRGNAASHLNPVPQPPRQQRNKKAKPQGRTTSPLIYGARMLILGVGIGVIAGTLLSIFDPASRMPKPTSQVEGTELQQSGGSLGNQAALAIPGNALQMTSEIEPLKKQLQELASQHADLTAGALFVDMDTGAYTDLNGSLSFAAASTIKVPILIAFFQDVDAGKIHLDEMLKMEAEDIAQGSGEMQYQTPGKQFSAIETAVLMISISDNTATNMLIKRMGGMSALNERFKSWGLNETAIRNPLPDLEGTNTTSPRDMGQLLALVNQGNLVSLRSRDRIFDIMRRTVNNSLLPQGLGKDATIAHKTGDIGSAISDVGTIDLPSGKRYLAAVIVKRPHNDARAEELIRQFSQKAYQFFSHSSK